MADKAEEVVEKKDDVIVKEEDTVQTPSLEDRARERGWISKEEFQGDPEDFVDAREFLAREPLYKAIHKHSRENKRLMEMNKEIKKLLLDTRKTAYSQAMKDLKAEYEAAAERGDVKAAVEAHGKMQEIEQEVKEKPTKQPAASDVFKSWAKENKWYNEDKVLKRYANGVGSELLNERLAQLGEDEVVSDDDLQEIYDQVAKEVKEAYPDKFKTRSNKGTVVESNTRTTAHNNTTSSKNKASYGDLPDEVQEIYRLVVKSKSNPNGTFDSGEEYIESYLAGGGTLRDKK